LSIHSGSAGILAGVFEVGAKQRAGKMLFATQGKPALQGSGRSLDRSDNLRAI